MPNPMGMKFGRTVPRLNMTASDMTSYFQDGGHDLNSHKASSPPCDVIGSEYAIQYLIHTCSLMWLTYLELLHVNQVAQK